MVELYASEASRELSLFTVISAALREMSNYLEASIKVSSTIL